MKNRIKKQIAAPLTREEVESAVNDIAFQITNRRRIETEINRLKLAVDEQYGKPIAALDEAIELRTAQVQAWAQAHPEEFEKRKSIEFASGTIGFRTGTPKLVLLNRKWTWEKALEAVQGWLPNFIRNKPEIDKEAIIAQADELGATLPNCGLKVTQAESFFIDPNITESDARQTEKVS